MPPHGLLFKGGSGSRKILIVIESMDKKKKKTDGTAIPSLVQPNAHHTKTTSRTGVGHLVETDGALGRLLALQATLLPGRRHAPCHIFLHRRRHHHDRQRKYSSLHRGREAKPSQQIHEKN